MLIYLLAFVGGVFTILSPCILPVLPFVFAHADRPFRRAGLPLLLGMALTFSIVATAAAYGGHWVARLNQGGLGMLDHRGIDEGFAHGILQPVFMNAVDNEADCGLDHALPPPE